MGHAVRACHAASAAGAKSAPSYWRGRDDSRSILQRPSAAVAFLAAGVVLIAAPHVPRDREPRPEPDLRPRSARPPSAAAVYGTWRHRPDRWAPWLLMAAGPGGCSSPATCSGTGTRRSARTRSRRSRTSLYLAGYPFIAAGLFLLIRRRVGDGDRGGLLDAAILTTAVAVLSWTFLMRPQVVGSELDTLSLSITLAYPIARPAPDRRGDGPADDARRPDPVVPMLGASLACLLVADQVYALQTLDGTYVAGSLLDNLYLAAYLLFGASALHPSMRKLTDPHPVPVTWLGPVRLLGLAAAMLTGPVAPDVRSRRRWRTCGDRVRHGAAVAPRARPTGRPGRAPGPRRRPAPSARERS